MSNLNLNWKFEKNDFYGSFNDIEAKKATISNALDILGFEVEINPDSDGKGIDLRAKHDHNIGVEVEGGYFIGNFWEDKYYSTCSNLGFPTVNMPIRKEKYYLPSYSFGYGKNKVIVDNKDKMHKVIFVRWNWDKSQAIKVMPEIVHNPEKLHRSKFHPTNKKTKGDEKFLSFKREDAVTYNKQIDNRFISDIMPNGKYVELSENERKRQECEVAMEKARIKSEDATKKANRAVEVYKNSKKKHDIQKSFYKG